MAQADIQRDGPRFRGRTTIRDIADLAGVSIATVSRVLNDRPDVAPDTRQTVLQVVREHGFSRNRGARALSRGRTGFIGLTLPLIADAYFGPILSGASEALYEEDMRIILGPTHHEHDREVSMLEHLVGEATDGAILMLPTESETELRELQARNFPFVVVDPMEPPPDGIPCVSAMHAAGAKQATEHLLQLGHRRIGAIAGAEGWYATEERLLGFRAALAGAGLLPDPALIRYSDWRTPAGETAAIEILDRPDRPTAIFAFNDNVAIGALNAARRLELAVPDDLSIVGFDDTFQSKIVWPQLTTVRQPLQELGRTGVSLLMRLLEGQRVEALRMELSTTLVVRASTAPPRESAHA
ncbi:MAG TPA: LacI family DNA-binding transcriptional regulator [Gaiellaceae bacterium]|jgi:LacI family transcriptional regulator|nr:LacI family DNA-binding transcriptional regulator [Gaiellaceae bacterium]